MCTGPTPFFTCTKYIQKYLLEINSVPRPFHMYPEKKTVDVSIKNVLQKNIEYKKHAVKLHGTWNRYQTTYDTIDRFLLPFPVNLYVYVFCMLTTPSSQMRLHLISIYRCALNFNLFSSFRDLCGGFKSSCPSI